MTLTVERRKLTPPQIAEMWGCQVEKILAFIHAGELRAINSTKPGCNQRPRYLVDIRDLEDFERRRTVVPRPSKPRPKRVASRPDDRY